MKCHVVKNDEVEIISGSLKGKRGLVLHVYPKTSTAIVKDLNKKWHFIRPSENGPGGMQEKEAPIPLCKLKVIDPTTNASARVGRVMDANGKLKRYFKKKRILM